MKLFSHNRGRWSLRIHMASMVGLMWLAPMSGRARTVRVGLYENPPKVFVDAEGQPAGMFVDVFDAIAAEEGWTVEYVPGTWAEGLQRLQEGRLDLMPDVARTEEREERMDFHTHLVMTAWSQIYTRRRRVEDLQDLRGARVAVLKGSVQERMLERVSRGFGLGLSFLPTGSFEAAFEAVRRGRADAVVTNQFYGDRVFRSYGLRKTPVIFNPVSLHFAAAEGQNGELLRTIDRYMVRWRNDGDSPLFKVMGMWMKVDSGSAAPEWIVSALVGGGAVILMLGIVAGLLRSRVRRATDDLRSSNASLRKSERKWRGYLEHAPFGVVVADAEGVYREVNSEVAALTGYTEREVIGTHFRDLLDEESVKRAEASFQRLVARGELDEEFVFRRKEGQRRWIRVRAVKLNEDRFLGFLKDVTEWKEAETARVHLQEELLHAQKMDAVGRLAGGVAHDYNNMLSVILSAVELVKRDMSESDPKWRDLECIRDAATRSAGLTRQLLTFARKQDSCPIPLNVNESVESMLEMLRCLAGRRIRIVWEPDEAVGNILADPVQIDQVIVNLVVNARDAIVDEGGIRLDTKLVRESEGGGETGTVRLTVEDDGPGISEETARHMFEPFFTTKSEDQGTGLGLSTVYGIVKRHGGDIRVESAESGGARFVITFPALPDHGADG